MGELSLSCGAWLLIMRESSSLGRSSVAYEITIRCSRCGHTGSVSPSSVEKLLAEPLPSDPLDAETVLQRSGRVLQKLRCTDCSSRKAVVSCVPASPVRVQDPVGSAAVPTAPRDPAAVASARRDLREAERRQAKKAAEREQRRARLKGSLPDYEDGTPRPGWYTDEDYRRYHSRYDGGPGV